MPSVPFFLNMVEQVESEQPDPRIIFNTNGADVKPDEMGCCMMILPDQYPEEHPGEVTEHDHLYLWDKMDHTCSDKCAGEKLESDMFASAWGFVSGKPPPTFECKPKKTGNNEKGLPVRY